MKEKPRNVMLYLEDIVIGAEFGTDTMVVTETMIREFAQQYDPQPFHLDPVAAHASVFGQLVASGWHTAALSMRLLVTGELQIANGLVGMSAESLAWPRSVLPGDTLRVVVTVLDIRASQSRPERGIVKTRNRTLNQRGEVVQELVANLLVLRKTA